MSLLEFTKSDEEVASSTLKIIEKKKNIGKMSNEFTSGKPVKTVSVKYKDPDGHIYVINLNMWPSGGISITKSKATDEGFKSVPVSIPQSKVPELILALQKLWIEKE